MSALVETIPLQKDKHGVYRVGGTRVTLDLLIEAHQAGLSPEAIAQDYDTLKVADIYAVIGFYLRNKVELDAYLKEGQEIAAKAEARSAKDCAGMREKLMARRIGKA